MRQAKLCSTGDACRRDIKSAIAWSYQGSWQTCLQMAAAAEFATLAVPPLKGTATIVIANVDNRRSNKQTNIAATAHNTPTISQNDVNQCGNNNTDNHIINNTDTHQRNTENSAHHKVANWTIRSAWCSGLRLVYQYVQLSPANTSSLPAGWPTRN